MASVTPRRGQRGFTLIELMVVVILVSILAVMATPAMLEAQKGRRAYEDAATIMMLFKNARTRAIGDQAAVAIIVNFDAGSTNRGVFLEYESTFGSATGAADPANAGGQSAMSSCTTPSNWNASVDPYNPLAPNTAVPHPVLVEGFNMQEPSDLNARVHLFVTSGAASAVNAGPFAFCFTPSGKMYTATGSSAGQNPTFDAPTTTPVLFTVKRDDGTGATNYRGPSRNVLVMPSGATRMYSS